MGWGGEGLYLGEISSAPVSRITGVLVLMLFGEMGLTPRGRQADGAPRQLTGKPFVSP